MSTEDNKDFYESKEQFERMARVANRMAFPDRDGVIRHPESVDVQIDRLSERIEMLEIANKVYRERLESIALRLNLLKGEIDEWD